MDGLEFRKDLYGGTARFYDRFRVPYPSGLIDDLLGRAEANGEGRLLDLACGTGQIGFAMHRSFEEVWAVDQEPDMIGVSRENAEESGVRNIGFLTSSAEDLLAPEESFDLVAIGNAFHRLRREIVARNAVAGSDPADISPCCGVIPLGTARHRGSRQCRPPSTGG